MNYRRKEPETSLGQFVTYNLVRQRTACNILVTTVGLGLYIKQVSFHSPRPLPSRSLVA